MLIAQVTDTHIRRDGELLAGLVDTAPFLERCVARVNAMRPHPDVVIVTGDLVDTGTAAEYTRLREIMKPLPCPYFVIAGNHDDRENLRRAFLDDGYLPSSGFLHYVVEDYPLRFIALDSLLPGSIGGRLCTERLAWLDARLNESSRPTIVCVHHPPFATGIEWMDREALEGAEEFAAIIRRHPQVERVLCGHIHRPIQVRWAGTMASTSPATAHQVVLDLEPGNTSAFVMEPSAFQLHLWNPGSGLVSHVKYCGTFSGPHPFRKAKSAMSGSGARR